jgi:acetyl esterase/lipase
VDIGHGSAETLKCVARLRAAGVEAEADVYHTDYHAFDLLRPSDPLSREAIGKLHRRFEQALKR